MTQTNDLKTQPQAETQTKQAALAAQNWVPRHAWANREWCLPRGRAHGPNPETR